MMGLHKYIKTLMFWAVLVCIASLDINIEGTPTGVFYTDSKQKQPSKEHTMLPKPHAALLNKLSKKKKIP